MNKTLSFNELLDVFEKEGAESAERRIKEGLDIHQKLSKHRNSFLSLAIDRNKKAFVEFLLSQGVKADDGSLLTAAYHGNHKMIEWCIHQGVDINVTSEYQNTALHIAIQNGDLDTVTYLVELGADIHCQNERGLTPLALGAYWAGFEMFEYLLSKGANINDSHAFYNYIGHENVPYHSYYSQLDGQNRTICIIQSIVDGTFERLKPKLTSFDLPYLLGKHPLHQTTPLMTACKHGDFKTIEYLIHQGSDVNDPHPDGRSNLMTVVERFKPEEKISLLANHGADFNYKKGAETVVTQAIQQRRHEVVMLFLNEYYEKFDDYNQLQLRKYRLRSVYM